MSKPLISVIIPVYNVETYLEACIKSVLMQSYDDLEILLVNDGSSDTSGEICDLYAEKDSRIKTIHKKNGGLSSARNTGLDHAAGEFICFVDSDDIIHPQFISILFGSLDGSDMAFCSYQTFEEDTPKDFHILDDFAAKTYQGQDMLSQIFSFKYPLLVIACNKIYKRQIWERIRFPLNKIHEDEFVVHLILDQCHFIKFVNHPLYYYRQRAGSVMTAASNRNAILNKMEAFALRRDFFLDRDMESDAQKLNDEILYRCLMATVDKDNPIWQDIGIRTIIFKSGLPVKARILLLVKKKLYGIYLILVGLLRKKKL
ncbi:glycosyltransferase family 2 protein [Sphingobacterium bambusae]|uniref:Glycosyltransferase family 2 protein n=2 Tax=Sphingobacterium bambusae TaxID=662858 RepID=A0ABW6BDQ9_9SPHI|nr:glycosyltransferase [Sphingobacterium bambusae]WPL46973.1 glycosyltransferase [Sphingobacterium bambusae]